MKKKGGGGGGGGLCYRAEIHHRKLLSIHDFKKKKTNTTVEPHVMMYKLCGS